MKSEPTEKPRGKKTAASETTDRKNGRSPSPGHDEWWERLMIEPGCNLQIFLCLFLEKLNMPQNTPVTKAS